MTKILTLDLPFEIKAGPDRTIEGHGSVFGNLDLGGDVVMPGAFDRTLAEHKQAGTMPMMFWMHDPGSVPGAWTGAKTDDTGLVMSGELADTQLGRETRTLAQMKAVRGLSIGYRTRDFDFDNEGNRMLKDVDLFEVSIVSVPMNPAANITAVKAAFGDNPRDLERHLRDVGCSHREAKRLVSDVFTVSRDANPQPLRDADDDNVDDDEAKVADMLADLSAEVTAAAIRRSFNR